MRITISGNGCIVHIYPDGTMVRGDVDLSIATKIKTISEAAKTVGLTRGEFIKIRNKELEQ